MSKPAMTVALLTRSEVLRAGMRAILSQLPEIAVIHDVAYEQSAAENVDFVDSDLLLLSCPRTDWARAAADRAAATGTRVLLLMDEMSAADPDAISGVPADGVLLKHAVSARGLSLALAHIEEGGFPMPAQFSRTLLNRPAGPRDSGLPRMPKLTPREQEALTLLAEGLSNRLIADRLRISEHGAKRLVANILAKLNCPNRTQATAVAIRENLLVSS
ncbi:response regulator transcription factor [Streptomyces sp. KR80]|uniref:response regulator transcription factor n=1 Tax=Streptomyces sp. KR80 TaxID=3457426 RepID=UPI003FD65324